MNALAPLAERDGWNVAPLLAIGSMVSIQSAAALSQPLLASIGPTPTTWIRLLAAAVVLLALTRPRVWASSLVALRSALLLGAALGAMSLFFYAALQRVPLGLTTTIAFLGPLAVATLGSRRSSHRALAALAACGVALLVRPQTEGWSVDLVGLALAGLTALCWAGYILLTKRVGAVFPGLQGLAISVTAAALLVTPLALVSLDRWPQPSEVMAAASLAVLTPLLTCGLEMMALRRMSPRPFGILMSLEPAIGVATGYLALRQVPNATQLLGVLCVILASVGTIVGDLGLRRGARRQSAPLLDSGQA